MKYQRLAAGEIIQASDEVDACTDPWRDAPKWVKTTCVGEPAPDPSYPSHRQYRRPIGTEIPLHSGNVDVSP